MKTNHVVCILVFVTTLVSGFSTQAQWRWSPQAKGTAIGAGVGGAAGAIINKRNRVVGGLIGAGAGAAGGYAVGKGIDNRRKTNARIEAAQREATAARREAALARQEAIAARSAANARQSDTRVAAVRRSSAPAVASVDAGTGAGVFTAAAFSAQTVAQPYANGNTLFLVNNTYGDQNTAYPTSDVRRKSW